MSVLADPLMSDSIRSPAGLADKAQDSLISLLRSGCSPILEPRSPGKDAGPVVEVGSFEAEDVVEETELVVETASLENEEVLLETEAVQRCKSVSQEDEAGLRRPGVSFAAIVNAKPSLPESMLGIGPGPVFSSWTSILQAASSPQAPDALKAAALLQGLAAVTSDLFCLPEDKRVANCLKWANSLIGKFPGRSPLFKDIVVEAGRKWGLKHENIFSFPNSFFCFRFSSEAELCDALSKGPLIVRGRLMSSMKWKEDFHWFRDVISTSPVWLRFDGLLPEFWDEETILNIAKFFGKPLMVDECTRRADRFHFARVCVEIDLTAPLKGGIWLKGGGKPYLQPVTYEDVPRICFVCGKAGHLTGECSKAFPSNLKAVMNGGKSMGLAGLPVFQEGVQSEKAAPELQEVGLGSGHQAEEYRLNSVLPANVLDLETPVGGSAQSNPDVIGVLESDTRGVVCAPGLGPWITVQRRRGFRRPQGPSYSTAGRQNLGRPRGGFRGSNQATAGSVLSSRVFRSVSSPPTSGSIPSGGVVQKPSTPGLSQCAIPVSESSPLLADVLTSSNPAVCHSSARAPASDPFSLPSTCTSPIGELRGVVGRRLDTQPPVVSNSSSAGGEECVGVSTTGMLRVASIHASEGQPDGTAFTTSLTPILTHDPFLTIDLSNPVTEMDGGRSVLSHVQDEVLKASGLAEVQLKMDVELEVTEQLGMRPPLHQL